MKSEYTKGMKITATYWTPVYKPNIQGWRDEKVVAELTVISPGKAIVTSAKMERAGSKRQSYGVGGNEMKQVGKTKIISKLSNVKVVKPSYPTRTL